MDKVNEIWRKVREMSHKTESHLIPVYEPAIVPFVMTDGFSVSVQARNGNYCSPRENYVEGLEYSEFELGFPSEFEPLLDEYADQRGTTDTVFGYVPVDVIAQVIEKHGDIDWEGIKRIIIKKGLSH